ncbi:MAG: DUF2306 domain-containing protein [Sulfitobacter sp.]
MSLDPLLNASLVIQVHTLCAIIAVGVVIAIFSIRRGSKAHKILGWIWVIAMAMAALSSFWIHEIRLAGPFSPIHLLSIITLVSLVTNIRAVRTKDIQAHQRGMKSLVFGALILAGMFTFLPGRIMYQVFLGG